MNKPVKITTYEAGFIYVMKNARNGYVKIGFSRNPVYREQTLQSEEPEINLLGSCFGSLAEEQQLHEIYKANRLRGEWFSLTDDQVTDLLTVFEFRTHDVARIVLEESAKSPIERQKELLRQKGYLPR